MPAEPTSSAAGSERSASPPSCRRKYHKPDCTIDLQRRVDAETRRARATARTTSRAAINPVVRLASRGRCSTAYGSVSTASVI